MSRIYRRVIQLTNGAGAPPTLSWVRIDGLPDIGDIPPGGKAIQDEIAGMNKCITDQAIHIPVHEQETSMHDKLMAVKRQIEAAFSDVPYPGDKTEDLVRLFAGDEGIEIADALKGKHWRALPIDILLTNHFLAQSLSHMQPKAFRFYLPGFLIATLDHRETDLAESTLHNIAPPQACGEIEDFPGVPSKIMSEIRATVKDVDAHLPEFKKKYEERMRLFSASQVEAILAFLNFLKLDEELECSSSETNRAIQYLTSMKIDL